MTVSAIAVVLEFISITKQQQQIWDNERPAVAVIKLRDTFICHRVSAYRQAKIRRTLRMSRTI